MEPTPSAAIIEWRNLAFGYGQKLVLDGVSMRIATGKVTALIGPMGAGKTTALGLIGGYHSARSGEVLFEGEDLGGMDRERLYAVRSRMGMMFQYGALFTDMSVFDNVAFPLREHANLPEGLIRDIVLMKLHAVGLRGARDTCPARSQAA